MEPLSVIAAANHSIPFMLAVGGTKEVNKTRIVEALIIGAVIAAAGKLFALPVLIEQIETVNRNIAKVEQQVAVVEAKLEIRRQVRDEQIDRLKKELSDLTIENSKRGHR